MDSEVSVDVSIVVPVFNEERLIPIFLEHVSPIMASTGYSWEVLFVDDGSSDSTWHQIQLLAAKLRNVRGISLTTNRGKELALYAGLSDARGRAHIPMDVDLQDPIASIQEMLDRWEQGDKLVLARRSSRKDSWLRNKLSGLFYRVIEQGSSAEIPRDVGDFRLMDAAVTSRFLAYRERSRYNKGILAISGGSRFSIISFDRPSGARLSSEQPRQNLGKLIRLALTAIISFSTWPLTALSVIGFVTVFGSITALVVSLILRTLGIIEVPGQATTILLALTIVGFQALSSGIIGIYLAEVLIEVKNRPLFQISDTTP